MPHKKRDRPRSKIVLAMAAEIRRLRKDRGWKLKHLAEASGLTIGFLSEAETGRCDPSLASLESIAASLGRRLSIAFIERPEFDYESGVG